MNIKKRSIKKFIITICFGVLVVSQVLLVGCTKAAKPSETFNAYKTYLQKQDFKSMYTLLSTEAKGKITEVDFIKRCSKIYSGIEAKNIKVKSGDVDGIKQDADKKIKIAFSVNMDTLAGVLEMPGYNMTLIKEKIDKKDKWTVTWDDNLILPELGAKDKVRALPIPAKRGQISDKNGEALAINGEIGSINIFGVDPVKFNPIKATAIPQIAKILDLSAEKVTSLLKTSTTTNQFVPIVSLASSDKDKATSLEAIAGVIHNQSKGRIYPGGEAFGNLIGYIGPITEEELKNHKDEGYSSTDKIGKMGLEQVYEKRLKGENGGEISILKNGEDTSKKVILAKQAKDGENIKLSIDINTQKEIYAQMKLEPGAATAINPKTGEILALVSSPSFDSNLYSTYIPDTINKFLAGTKNPTLNRFKAVYAPGSTFKLVTGAIGLKTGSINPAEALSIDGLLWQQGAIKVKRTHPTNPVNLQDAYVYSDNVYFARQALKIGKDNFTKEVKNFGIGETLPIDYPIVKSQLSNSGLNSDQLIADTGFGQGEVQLSPLNLALIYSSLANNGDIMTPILELKADIIPKVWKEKAIPSANVKTLTDDLVQVVDNPNGTGHTPVPSKVKLLGKTGTAELKKDQQDIAEENGWFVAMNVDNPSLVVSMMIENVKNTGESGHVVPMVKKVFDDLVK